MHPRTAEMLGHLDRTRQALRDSVAPVPPEKLDVAPGDNRWTVLGVLEHLSIVEPRLTGLLGKKIDEARAGGLGPDGETTPLLPTQKLDRFLNRTATISAHESIHPKGGRDLAALWSALDQSREALRAMILAADGLALEQVMHAHPAFGPMNLYEWYGFIGAHEERHADQIREIVASLGA